ncbi:hypothetical protein G3480_06415 [Thiorhodococcus mannitoliphagus]|uniref:Uncharacterized protein n=1 Tax=Thiorhodococcus mannitoliphagus TaxID=329406 RepID=A0A6P1DPM0_9GAMM|nr:hypothetical protein [Thiorhodococcus mannitoliphagus]NEX19948.1 hypothetical protein [Thiorhodococcus mannitoliphagus]
MFQIHSARIVTVAALCLFLLQSGHTWAGQDLKAGAAAALEVRVLEVQIPPGQGDRSEVLYRMEVISVLRSTVRVTPGDTIVVRAYAASKDALGEGSAGLKAPDLLAAGWMGVAYLNPDPKASGPEAGRQFTIAAKGDSFEDIPQGPPSLRWTQ